MAAPEFELGPQFPATELAGRTFAYVSIITNSIIQEKYAAFAEALASVGAKAIYFDGKGRPDTITEGIQSAIAQNVSGIVADGIDAAALAGGAVRDANAAGIPVINTNAGNAADKPPAGIAAAVSPDLVRTGALQADYGLAKTDCKLTALNVFTSSAKLTVDVKDAFEGEVKGLCADDCEVATIDFNAATYPTELEPQVRTELQRQSDIDVIALSPGDLIAQYTDAAIGAVGSPAIIVGAQGDGLGEAMKGSRLKADVVWPASDTLGYYAADAIMRAALKTPRSVVLPVRLVDSSNWGDNPSASAQFPGSEQLPAQFKALWGVG